VWKRRDLRAILLMLALIGTFGLTFPYLPPRWRSRYSTRMRGALACCLRSWRRAPLPEPSWRRDAISPTSRPCSWGPEFLEEAVCWRRFPGYWWFAAALVLIRRGRSHLHQCHQQHDAARNGTLHAGPRHGPASRRSPWRNANRCAVGGVDRHHYGPRLALGIGALSGVLAAGVAVLSMRTEDGASSLAYQRTAMGNKVKGTKDND
jgi:hypothetical protein